MKTYLRLLAPLLLLCVCAPALAQVYPYTYNARPVQWFFDAGPSFTTGQTANFLDNGWTIGTGVTFRPQPAQPFMLRLDLNYTRLGATDQLIALGQAANPQTEVDNGYGTVVSGHLNGVLEEPLNPWARFYLTGGVGAAYRRIDLTQNSFFCAPFFCGNGYGGSTVASNETTRFAWNAGLGFDFLLPAGQSWFVEARYERIETPQPTELIPVRFGIRF